MKIYVFQPFKRPHTSRYETYFPILTCDKRYNTQCFSALWLNLALGSDRVRSPYLSRLCMTKLDLSRYRTTPLDTPWQVIFDQKRQDTHFAVLHHMPQHAKSRFSRLWCVMRRHKLQQNIMIRHDTSRHIKQATTRNDTSKLTSCHSTTGHLRVS